MRAMTSQFERRSAYPHFLAIPTRWMDNDVYGHVNNVVYYAYFDTVINESLIREGGLDIHDGAAAYAALASGAQKLISPAEMGELFKVLALGRGIEAPLQGFARGDRLHAL